MFLILRDSYFITNLKTSNCWPFLLEKMSLNNPKHCLICFYLTIVPLWSLLFVEGCSAMSQLHIDVKMMKFLLFFCSDQRLMAADSPNLKAFVFKASSVLDVVTKNSKNRTTAESVNATQRKTRNCSQWWESQSSNPWLLCRDTQPATLCFCL